MKKSVVIAVMAMSIGLINCAPAVPVQAVPIATFEDEGVLYEKEIVVKEGATVTDKDVVQSIPDGVTIKPFSKTYKTFGKYKEKFQDSDGITYSYTVIVEAKGAFKLVGVKNITVTEGKKFNVLSGVRTTKEATLKVSKYDKTLVDVPQKIKITAIDMNDKKVSKTMRLYIKNKPVKKIKKWVYMKCVVNMHIKPAYRTKNLGTIPYNKKVKAIGIVKVGKYNWYKVKFRGKTSFIFANATSKKKLPKVDLELSGAPKVATPADDAYYDNQDLEDMREGGRIDHNGKIVVDKGNIS